MKIFKSNSVFFKFLYAFVILVLFPVLLISFVSNYLYSEALNEEIDRNNSFLISKTTSDVENKLEDIKLLMYKQILSINEYSGDYIKMLEIEKQLNRILATDEFIKDVFVYYSDTGRVLTSNGMYYSDYYFNKVYKPKNLELDEWYNLLNSRNDFLINGEVKMLMQDHSDEDLIAILTSFPLHSISTNGSLVVLVDTKTLMSILVPEGFDLVDRDIMILDSELNIIAGTESEYMNYDKEEIKKFLSVMSKVKGSYQTDNKRDLLLQSIDSKVENHGMNYLIITDIAKIYEDTRYVRNISIVLSIIILVIGILLAVLVARNMYRPIHEIVGMFSKSSSDFPVTEKENEYQIIINHYNYIVEKNYRLQKKMNENSDMIKDYYVKSLLLGCIDGSKRKEIYNSLDTLVYPFFTVIIVNIHSLDKNDGQDETIRYISIKDGIMTYISKFFNGQKQITGIITSVEKSSVSVLVNHEINKDVLKTELSDLSTQMSDLTDKFCCFLTICVGSIEKNIMDLNRSYENALKSMSSRKLKCTNEIIFYDDINMPLVYNIDYQIELEKEVIYHVVSGDCQDVKRSIDNVFSNNNISEDTSYGYIIQLHNELLGTLNKIIIQNNIDDTEIFNFNDKRLFNDDVFISVEDVKDNIEKAYEKLTIYFYNKMENRNTELKNRIIEFINKNYMKDLSLDIMADEFNMNAKYLSRYFKNQTGINFVDFVNKVRIEKAKELLQNNPDSKINDISEALGFLYVSTFITTFKKYEGMSPGKFVKMLCRRSEENGGEA